MVSAVQMARPRAVAGLASTSMARHRPPCGLPLTRRRPALALAFAGAASAAVVLDVPALADPQPSLPEVEERVDSLHHEAEEATERYNAATEDADEAREELDMLREEAARRTEELNDARDALGAHATAQYRAGGLDPSVQLALSSDPEEYLERAELLDRTGDRQARAVQEVQAQVRDIDRLLTEAEEQSELLAEAEERAREERETVEGKLAEAEELMDSLSARERERLLDEEGLGDAAAAGTAGAGTGAPGMADAAGAEAPSQRAASAVTYAYAQLGKPYGWGSAGPDAFDCSGLTQAAWGAAGVALPRTSQAQAGAGTSVTRSELAPGDLVFYYSGFSHVGMYVGNGQIIHASRSGTPVRMAPVDSMPLVAAVRPA